LATTRIIEHSREGRSVAVFRNTVSEAIATYDGLRELTEKADLPKPVLWHSRFLAVDRNEIERTVEAIAGKNASPDDRLGRVVVMTQVGEQSLDLDFDVLVSDLAPVDVLVQRIGRCRRHRRDATGRLKNAGNDERLAQPILLLAPDPEQISTNWYSAFSRGSAYVYPDDARLMLTLLHLLKPSTIPDFDLYGTAGAVVERRGRKEIILDEDLKPLMESVYADTDALKAGLETVLKAALPTKFYEDKARDPAVAALMSRHHRAEGEAQQDRSEGRRNRLNFTKGYFADFAAQEAFRDDDERAPTRLGDQERILVFFRDHDTVCLAGAGAPDPIVASEIRLNRWQGPRMADSELEETLSVLSPRERRRARFMVPVIMSPEAPAWRAEFNKGSAYYDRERGFRWFSRDRQR
jgi:CRISPR-associated endonuclease/helicase Cas3